MRAAGRPVLALEPSPGERALDLIAIAGVLFAIADLALHWTQIPERVPSHFQFDGSIDGYAGKGTLWLLPSIAAAIVVGFTFLRRLPHCFNYPCAVTPENAPAIYRAGRDLLTWLKAAIAVSFAVLVHLIMNMSLGASTAPIAWALPVMLAMIFGSVGWQIVRMVRAR